MEVRSCNTSGEFQIEGFHFPVEFMEILDESVVFIECSELLLSLVVLSELTLAE